MARTLVVAGKIGPAFRTIDHYEFQNNVITVVGGASLYLRGAKYDSTYNYATEQANFGIGILMYSLAREAAGEGERNVGRHNDVKIMDALHMVALA